MFPPRLDFRKDLILKINKLTTMLLVSGLPHIKDSKKESQLLTYLNTALVSGLLRFILKKIMVMDSIGREKTVGKLSAWPKMIERKYMSETTNVKQLGVKSFWVKRRG